MIRATRLSTIVLFAALVATEAQADGVLVGEGGSVKHVRIEAFLHSDGRKQTLVETVELTGSAASLGWIRAFPSRPSLSHGRSDLFAALHRITAVKLPRRTALQRRVFGPSLVTLIGDRLSPPPAEPPPPPSPDRPRIPERLGDIAFFQGRAVSSTITLSRELPPPLTKWLAKNRFVLTRAEKIALLRYCDSGWVLAARRIDVPGGIVDGIVGPTVYRYVGDTPVHPALLALSQPDPNVPIDYFLLSTAPRVSAAYDTIWDDAPYKRNGLPLDTFVTTFNRPLAGPEEDALSQALGGPLPSGQYLLHGEMRIKTSPSQDMQFVRAQEPVDLPVSSGRDSPVDLVLCLLLGLAPLLYTPESWFFLWLAARAKGRTLASGEPGPGWLLWPAYAIVVGLFWGFTQDGAGRIAGVLPVVVGVFRFATGRPRPALRPVRAKFPKKRSAR